jgi:hypothetical protein
MISSSFIDIEFKPQRNLLVGILLIACCAFSPSGIALAAEPDQFHRAIGHVALILPLNSPSYGVAAEAVKEGFLSARDASDNATPPVKIYPTDGSVAKIIEAYQVATINGASLAVGPLTRNGVTGLIRNHPCNLPTLALNQASPDSVPPPDFHFFGLGLEDEVRQTAQLMWQKTGHTVFVAASNSPLFRRATEAFTQEWVRLGGRVIGPHPFSSRLDELLLLRKLIATSGADTLFLAADESDSCRARPFLGKIQPIYGISLANNGFLGEHCLDLQGVHFLDMPWMVEPATENMATRPGAGNSEPAAQRFFALGADSYRLAVAIMRGAEREILDLPGLSGQISHVGNTFSRTLISAKFDHDGIPRILADKAQASSAEPVTEQRQNEKPELISPPKLHEAGS